MGHCVDTQCLSPATLHQTTNLCVWCLFGDPHFVDLRTSYMKLYDNYSAIYSTIKFLGNNHFAELFDNYSTIYSSITTPWGEHTSTQLFFGGGIY